MSGLAKQLAYGEKAAKVYAKGGKVHDDAAMDKKLIKETVKPGALKKAGGGVIAVPVRRPVVARRPAVVPVPVAAPAAGVVPVGLKKGGKAKKGGCK